MNIRSAKVDDVKAIHSLISCYAELDRMLFRSLTDIYENLQIFKVARDGDKVVGCCALQVVWADLGEIKSLAVDRDYLGKGVGRAIVEGCMACGVGLGLKRLFTLTLEPEFFERLGFVRVDKDTLPMKVWSDCAQCPKQANCDETALVIDLSS